jgi:hypothetical protein
MEKGKVNNCNPPTPSLSIKGHSLPPSFHTPLQIYRFWSETTLPLSCFLFLVCSSWVIGLLRLGNLQAYHIPNPLQTDYKLLHHLKTTFMSSLISRKVLFSLPPSVYCISPLCCIVLASYIPCWFLFVTASYESTMNHESLYPYPWPWLLGIFISTP